MMKSPLRSVLRHLHRLAGGPPGVWTDRQLLERFARQGDEAAFAALVERHGAMVLGAAWRILRHSQDAEDVSQAAFLVLAKKADALPWRDSVAGWLHEVAVRLARKARADRQRRQGRERRAAMHPEQTAPEAPNYRELCAILDEELQQMPPPCRDALLLCYLQGLTRDEAARRLGWSLGTLKRRLERGRGLLRARLSRRGLTLPAALLVWAWAAPEAGAASAIRAAGRDISPRVSELAEGALRTMTRNKLAPALLALLSLGVTLAGVAALAPREPPAEPPPAAPGPAGVDAYGDRLPPGVVARLGSVRLRHAGPVVSLQFSADGKRLLSQGQDGATRLWETASGKELHRFTAHSGWGSAAFGTGGAVLSLDSDGATLSLWDVATGKRLRVFRGHREQVYRMELSPDGKWLASVAVGADGTLRLWDAATGAEKARWPVPQPGIQMLGFSADGAVLAAADHRGLIRLHETATGKELCRVEGAKIVQNAIHASLACLAFSPDGKTLATGRQDNTVHLWQAATGKELRAFDGGGVSLAFTADGKTLASGAYDGTVRLWDVASGRELRKFAAHFGWVNALAFSRDGKTLATGGGGIDSHRIHGRYHHSDSTIRLWDVATGAELPQSRRPHGAVVAVAYSPDGQILAAGGKDRLIRLWRAATGEQIRTLTGHEGTVHALAFSPDGQTLASGGGDKTVRLWQAATGRELHRLSGHDAEVVSLAFAPDGKTLASAGGYQKPVFLWDVATGKQLRLLRGHASGAFAVAFATAGRQLATGGGQAVALPPNPDVDNSIRLWDAAGGKEVRRLPGPPGDMAFFALAFSPDGKTLASGCRNGPMRLWEVATGQARLTISGGGDGTLAFSPDGRTLVDATPRYGDRSFRLWDVLTGKERRIMSGHEGDVYAAAFSPDGKTLASASEDTTVLIWDVSDLLATKKTERELTARDVQAQWSSLANADAPRAYQAIQALAAAPRQAVPFLGEHLDPVRVSVDRPRITRLIADLDSERFEVRQKAADELAKLGDLAEPELRKAATAAPSLEVRKRVDDLLEKVDRQLLTGDELRALRAIEVLERIGTPEARRVLEALARGTPELRQTREARAALERLQRRSALLRR